MDNERKPIHGVKNPLSDWSDFTADDGTLIWKVNKSLRQVHLKDRTKESYIEIGENMDFTLLSSTKKGKPF